MNRNQLRKYLKLTLEEKKKVQDEYLTDSFVKEALEGFENMNFNHIKKLDSRFNKNYNIINFSLFLLTFLVYFFGIMWINQNTRYNKTTYALQANNDTKENENNVGNSLIIKNFKNSENVKTLDSSFVFETKLALQKQKLQQSSKIDDKNQALNLDSKETKIIHENIREEVDLKSINPNYIVVAPIINLGHETYLQDLLVLDYRFYRKKPKIELNPILNGVPASEENTPKNQSLDKELEISYMNYLSKTLFYFKEKKYNEAIKRFDIILNVFPDDINALFYKSICFYNLRLYENSITQLNTLNNSFYTNFKEDQEWYLLLCYKATQNEIKFNQQKSMIIARNKFYRSKAEKISFTND